MVFLSQSILICEKRKSQKMSFFYTRVVELRERTLKWHYIGGNWQNIHMKDHINEKCSATALQISHSNARPHNRWKDPFEISWIKLLHQHKQDSRALMHRRIHIFCLWSTYFQRCKHVMNMKPVGSWHVAGFFSPPFTSYFLFFLHLSPKL